RRGHGVGKKVLIVLDQFEQWLHASRSGEPSRTESAARLASRSGEPSRTESAARLAAPTGDEQDTELVQALRQCDGSRVQCIVMVRDDFWMAATRFMHELEIRLVEGDNSAAVDLFPMRHAEKVLA